MFNILSFIIHYYKIKIVMNKIIKHLDVTGVIGDILNVFKNKLIQ